MRYLATVLSTDEYDMFSSPVILTDNLDKAFKHLKELIQEDIEIDNVGNGSNEYLEYYMYEFKDDTRFNGVQVFEDTELEDIKFK